MSKMYKLPDGSGFFTDLVPTRKEDKMVARPYKKPSGPGSKPQHADHKPQKPAHKSAHKHRSNKGRKLEQRLAGKEM